jgi:hypothetical protein
MPNYELSDGRGNILERITLSSAELAAEEDQRKALQVEALDIAALRGLFNHENRLRALVRGVRANATTAQRSTLDAQGVEPTRPDMSLDDFKQAIKALL